LGGFIYLSAPHQHIAKHHSLSIQPYIQKPCGIHPNS
jgi:hypothetical protein